MATEITPQSSMQPVQVPATVTPAVLNVVPAPAKPENIGQSNSNNVQGGQGLPLENGAEKKNTRAGKDDLEEVVRNIKDHIQNIQRDLQFNIDEYSGQTVVKVVDAETDKVIRQIPSEEVLELHQQLDKVAGLLLKEEA